jgi:hypothetical protein
MAPHRDIYWLGRQWAVTGYRMQAIDPKRNGEFDIEVSRLWKTERCHSNRDLGRVRSPWQMKFWK